LLFSSTSPSKGSSLSVPNESFSSYWSSLILSGVFIPSSLPAVKPTFFVSS
jgi:hypothetical protein